MNRSGTANRWGHLTKMRSGADIVTAKDPKGEVYETGEMGPEWMDLRCDCGHEFRIFIKDFPGRRDMRYCMREQCMYAPQQKGVRGALGRPRVYPDSVNFSVGLPKWFLEGVETLVENGTFRSKRQGVAFFAIHGLKEWQQGNRGDYSLSGKGELEDDVSDATTIE